MITKNKNALVNKIKPFTTCPGIASVVFLLPYTTAFFLNQQSHTRL